MFKTFFSFLQFAFIAANLDPPGSSVFIGHHLQSVSCFPRPAMDSVKVGGSLEHTDPKQLRKLRQQQLQQKFRREMESRKLQQIPGQAKCEDTWGTTGRASAGGGGFTCCHKWCHRFFFCLKHELSWHPAARFYCAGVIKVLKCRSTCQGGCLWSCIHSARSWRWRHCTQEAKRQGRAFSRLC